jgi:putative ABC transport system ATP-binding protein
MDGEDDADCADALLRGVGVWHRHRALLAELSGSKAALAGLAIALARSPALLLADEPTGEVDAATEKDLLRLAAPVRHRKQPRC